MLLKKKERKKCKEQFQKEQELELKSQWPVYKEHGLPGGRLCKHLPGTDSRWELYFQWSLCFPTPQTENCQLGKMKIEPPGSLTKGLILPSPP